MARLPSLPTIVRRTAPAPTILLLVVVLVAGCAKLVENAPVATPLDFPGIAGQLARRGIAVDKIASGDAGCQDAELARTAIRFAGSGLDQATPVTLYVYIFRDRAAYDRRRQSVDACARSYVSDPLQLGSVDAPPFVVMGRGPWAPRFAAALRSAMTEAAALP